MIEHMIIYSVMTLTFFAIYFLGNLLFNQFVKNTKRKRTNKEILRQSIIISLLFTVGILMYSLFN